MLIRNCTGLLIVLFMSIVSFASGQNTETEKVIEKDKVQVSNTQATFLGKTKPVREMVAKPGTSAEKKAALKRMQKRPPNFIGRGHSLVTRPELEHQGPDKVRQKSFSSALQRRAFATLVNIDGLENGGTPHDPTGDIGQDYYVQAVNRSAARVYDKEGNTIETFNLNTLWSGLGFISRGDPIILYDGERKQWLITAFANPAELLIAVSETSDPLGSYYAYSFSTPNFPDYPKYGIWSNHVMVTSNEEGPRNLHHYFLERDSLMSGAETVLMQRVRVDGPDNSEQGFIVTTPVDWNGELRPNDDRPISLRLNDSSWGEVSQDQLELYLFDINYASPDSTVVTQKSIVTSPYDANPCSATGGQFPCIPQLDGNGLDALPELIVHVPHYRNFGTHESIVLNFVTDVTDGDDLAGVRWVELRKSGEEDWSLRQEGTIALDDGLHRFMGGIAIDRFGNIGLAYNVSSAESYAGIRFTGRFATDPLGIMTIPEQIVIEGIGSTGLTGRFGDYPQMSIDPLDGSTFWYTSEYGDNNGASTRIVAFQLFKDTFDLSANRFISPTQVSNQEPMSNVSVVVQNAGLTAMSDFKVGFEFNGSMVEELIVADTLQPDSALIIDFMNSVDLSALGSYPMRYYVSHPDDNNARNDTLSSIIRVLTRYDAVINSQSQLISCSDQTSFDLDYRNLGSEPFSEILVALDIEGTRIDTFRVDTLLLTDEGSILKVSVEDLPEGKFDAVFSIISLDGQMDMFPENDTSITSVSVRNSMGRIQLDLLTDQFPLETAWIIKPSGVDTTLFISPGYNLENTLYSQEFCLVNNQCYDISFIDTENDGICCQFGEGSINVLDFNGDTLFYSDGDYGSGIEFEICLGTAACNVSADIEFTNPSTSDDDGTIMITGLNGNGSYLYSIDSGVTYQTSGIFDSLAAGTYNIFVQVDGMEDCFYTDTVTLSMSTATFDLSGNSVDFKVLPNPNNGYFQVEISGLETDAFQMEIEVFSIEGQRLQTRKIGKYDGVFTGQFSLLDYPDGTYLLRIMNKDVHQMAKVIKQD